AIAVLRAGTQSRAGQLQPQSERRCRPRRFSCVDAGWWNGEVKEFHVGEFAHSVHGESDNVRRGLLPSTKNVVTAAKFQDFGLSEEQTDAGQKGSILDGAVAEGAAQMRPSFAKRGAGGIVGGLRNTKPVDAGKCGEETVFEEMIGSIKSGPINHQA